MKNKTTTAPLILASASPRRLALLAQIGITPDQIIAADIDEQPHLRELPQDVCARLSTQKAQYVAKDHPNSFVLSGDTVVACGRRILPKADTEEQARACLTLLSGRRHRVWGGITLITPDGKTITRTVCSIVTFKRLTTAEMSQYIASGEWQGKAGGYAIQGLAAAYVRFVSGSYSNIVGLSLYDTMNLLTGNGFVAERQPTPHEQPSP